MTNDNPFTEAMDDEDPDEETSSAGEFDLGPYYDALTAADNPKDHTIGIAASEEMHAFFRELKNSDEVDVDPAESIRNHLGNLARRHEREFERAMRKLEIDREV